MNRGEIKDIEKTNITAVQACSRFFYVPQKSNLDAKNE